MIFNFKFTVYTEYSKIDEIKFLKVSKLQKTIFFAKECVVGIKAIQLKVHFRFQRFSKNFGFRLKKLKRERNVKPSLYTKTVVRPS